MATIQEALEVLKSATHDDMVEVIHREDGVTVIKVIPRKNAGYEVPEKGKWARVAEELSEKAPLTGIGEEFLEHAQEFRKNFSLKSPLSEEK